MAVALSSSGGGGSFGRAASDYEELMKSPALSPIAKQLGVTNLNETINKTGTTTTNTTQKLVEQIREQQVRQWQEQINETMNEVVTRGDPASMAALQNLIQTLVGGGTAEQQAQRQARQEEIVRARQGASDYSKGNAFMDAAGASQAASRQSMEQAMGNLNRAIAGAGTSGGSMQALLAQRAVRDAAELQSKMQLEAATQYGGIATQYQSILEALTRPDNSQVDSLLAALQLAQNANQSTTRNTQTNRFGQETTTKDTNRTQQINTNSVTNTIEDTLRNLVQNSLQLGGGGGGSVRGGGSVGGIRPSSGGSSLPSSPGGLYGAGNLSEFGSGSGLSGSGFIGTGDSSADFGLGGNFADGTSITDLVTGPMNPADPSYFGDGK